MAHYKLTYFDVDGGRGEPIRIALHKAGIEFEDHRISFDEFLETRGGLRFGAVPVLEMDGEVVTQSDAIARYIGKRAGLYPEDDRQALYCDEALGAAEDALHAVTPTFGLEGEALKTARKALVDGKLTTYIRGLGELLARGGDYFADGRLTIADLKVVTLTYWFSSGMLDHVPTDLVARVAPALVEHAERVASDPVVKAWYASRSGK